jgi:hypothetical protein
MYKRFGADNSKRVVSDIVRLAARTNAEWCDIVCRSHGVAGTFESELWACTERTPPLYPDAVTLAASASEELVLQRVDTSPGCSIKDSFSSLDLRREGFRILFVADWINCPPVRPLALPQPALRWQRVASPEAFGRWEEAWRSGPGTAGVFLPSLLSEPRAMFVSGFAWDRVLAGAVLNRSSDAIGISNVFARCGTAGEPYLACRTIAAQAFGELPLVGYESGENVAVAEAAGFRRCGRLVIWVKDPASRRHTSRG